MTDDARPDEAGTTPDRRARRRRPVLLAAAVALLLGGATAVAVAVVGQDPAPPSVSSAESTAAAESAAPAATPSAQTGSTSTPPAESSAPAEPVEAEEAPEPLPSQVTIPSIDVSSELLHLGLNDDGTVAVPEGDDVDSAAWFDGSPRPGAVGPAVIEGHVDSQNGPSVFYDLVTLEPGAEVSVDREDGTEVTYVVDRLETYPKDEFPTLAVYGNTDGPELRLITCGGLWDPETGHYRDNTVVYASLAA